MTKILFLLLPGLFTIIMARSQQLSPSVLAAEGGINNAAGISLEWTLGETLVESLSTSNRLYTQGFHQPLLLVKKKPVAVEQTPTGYGITVAPNPVRSYLTATITSATVEKMFLSLIDFTGRVIPIQAVYGKLSTVKINMSAMMAGIYLLEIRNVSGKLINTFKIIKGQ